jgi:hypothetical protein
MASQVFQHNFFPKTILEVKRSASFFTTCPFSIVSIPWGPGFTFFLCRSTLMVTTFGGGASGDRPFDQRVFCHLAKSGHFVTHLTVSQKL